MRGSGDDLGPGLATTVADVEEVVLEGRFGNPRHALRELDAALAGLDADGDPEVLLTTLYGRALLLRLAGAPTAQTLGACEDLERAATRVGAPLWTSTARALRAVTRLERGEGGQAMTDLARIELEPLEDRREDRRDERRDDRRDDRRHESREEPRQDRRQGREDVGTSRARHRLLDTVAGAFLRLRLYDQLEETRAWLESLVDGLGPADRATHWTRWAIELATRAMEPLARGAQSPDRRLLDRAADTAGRTLALDPAQVPVALLDGARIVQALAHAWAGRPGEALGLNPEGARTSQRETSGQLAVLAAMRAHLAVNDGQGAQRAIEVDERSHRPTTVSLPNLVLEVARARERLDAERAVGGDVVPVLHRLTELLVQLGWQGMALVPDTARQALEHQTLRTESRTDPLTGAGNRRALDEELRHMLRFTPLPLALVLVDVDHFKAVNDEHTHVVGDEVLRRVSAALADVLRPTDRLIRYGGDEFVVLLPGAGEERARRSAEAMTAAVALLPWSDLSPGLSVQVTTGHAVLDRLAGRRPDGDAERLFRRADEALLAAKHRRPGPDGEPPRPRVIDVRDLPDPERLPRPEPEPLPQPEPDCRPTPEPPVLRSPRLPRVIDLSRIDRPSLERPR